MIKVWCETCEGKKGKYAQLKNEIGILAKGLAFEKCPDCDGKGYTKHEGSLEDLELAAAVKAAISSGVRIIFAECNPEKWLVKNEKTSVTMKLLDWYREQKGGDNE